MTGCPGGSGIPFRTRDKTNAMILGLVVAMVFAFFVAACGADGPLHGVRHPQERYVVATIDPTADLRMDEADTLLGAPAWLTSIADSQPIGLLDGTPEHVFGKIEDVVVDQQQGRLYVLDSRFHEVRVFSLRGHFVETVGRPGRGPGEFVQPTSLAIDRGSGRIFVGDGNFTIHVFNFGNGGLRFQRSFRTRTRPEDICVMHDELFVHGLTLMNKRALHVYGLDGQHRRSFGVVYDSGEPLIDFEIATGRIACVPSDSIVIYTPRQLLPEVRAYSYRGGLVWRTTLSDYRPLIYEEIPGGSRRRLPANGFHRLISVIAGCQGNIMLQFAVVVNRSEIVRSAVPELQTLTLSAHSGSGSRVEGIREEIRMLSCEYAIFSRDIPYPQLIVVFDSRAAVGGGA